MKILITGGAGFIGAHLGLSLKRDLHDAEVLAFDNLRRRGSELAPDRLKAGGVTFVHGDVRSADDLAEAGTFDLLLECSAEPSVHAGYAGSPAYVLNTNLVGTINCLEAARRSGADIIFLSTSRVYPIAGLRALPLERQPTRFDVREAACGIGWSHEGINTDFPLAGHRSLYGATKLASELLVSEYRAMYGLRAVINRCGVVAGPWQMGKVDQGFLVLWAARHLFGRSISFTGFGGEGLQVRDVLHVADLCELVRKQIISMSALDGSVFNVGGGRQRSVSLRELTAMCRERSRRDISLRHVDDTNPADVPFYVSDNGPVTSATGWQPHRSLDMLLDDVFAWLREHRTTLEPLLREDPEAVPSSPVEAS